MVNVKKCNVELNVGLLNKIGIKQVEKKITRVCGSCHLETDLFCARSIAADTDSFG